MRACGSCFYFQGDRNDAGECFNRPPYIHVVSQSGGSFEQYSLRPAVRSDEYCSFFKHHAMKPI